LGRFIDVCNAVGYAHSRGVLHRDLKPGNVMLGKYGETLVVDWGLAKAKGRSSDAREVGEPALKPSPTSASAPTVVGSAVGTPAYMSPEQAVGRLDELGPRADVYSLGATLYYVLTGRPPFASEDVGTTLKKVQRGEFSRPREAKPAVPLALQAICLNAMALRAADRYSSPREVADDVERYLADEPVVAHAEPLTAQTRRWLRKHPRTVAALAATVLVGLTSAIAITGVVSSKNRELARANASLRAANVAERKANLEAENKRKEAEAAREQERLAKLEAENKRKEAEAAREQERLAKLEAETKRKEAENARAQAEAVSRYLAEAFRSPDPARNGRTITMAEVLDRSAKDMRTEFANDPRTKATLLNAIGQAYLGLGLYHESIPLFEQARDLIVAAFGNQDADSFAPASNLAAAYREAGKVDQALLLDEETLKLRKERFGPEHPDTLVSMSNLAVSYHAVGKRDQALLLNEQTLKLRKEKLGPEHPQTLLSMNNLAASYQALGKRDQALLLHEETLKLVKQKLGPEHPQTLLSMNNLAVSYQDTGKLDRALPLFEDTLKLSRAKLGDDHPRTLNLVGNLARAYLKDKQSEKALALFNELVARQRLQMSSDAPRFTALLHDVGFNLARQGEHAAAEGFVRECMAIREMNAPDDWQTFYTKSLLGAVLAGQKKFDEAEPLLLSAYEEMKTREGKIPQQIRATRLNEALSRLVNLYTAWDKPQQASLWWMTKMVEKGKQLFFEYGSRVAAYIGLKITDYREETADPKKD
jgi:hypothetical protein